MKNQSNQERVSFFSLSRTAKKKLLSAACALLLLVALVGVNLLTSILPWKARSFTIGADSVFRISSSTKEVLTKLDEDISIYMICEGGELTYDRNVYAFLKHYETLSSRVSVEILNSSTETEFLTKRQLGDLSGETFILVESARRHMLIPLSELYYYYCEALETAYPSYQYEASGAAMLAQMGLTATPYFNGEDGVTNAIDFVTREDVPTVAVISAAIQSPDGSISSLNAPVHSAMLRLMMKNGCDVRYIASVSQLTSEHEALIYNAPYIDISKEEATHFSAWLANGGNLLLTTYHSTVEQPNLDAVLAEYGLSHDDKGNRIVETSTYNKFAEKATSYYMYPNIPPKHVMVESFHGYLVIGEAHALYYTPLDHVKVTPFLTSSDSAYREKYDVTTGKVTLLDEEDFSTFNYGLIAETDQTKIVWVSTPLVFDFDYNSYALNGNFKLMLSAVDWLTDGKGDLSSISFDANSMTVQPLLFTQGAYGFWSAVLIFIIPFAVLTIGLVRDYVRKKK